jgi:hypothetical protein
MVLMKPGCWHDTAWADRSWPEDLWLEYGAAPAPSFASYGVPFLYTAANWGAVNFYLEVYVKATAGTVYARLYNVTDSAAVAGSQLSTAAVTYQRLRTAALTLTNGKTYRAQFGKEGADAGKFLGAKLVVTD